MSQFGFGAGSSGGFSFGTPKTAVGGGTTSSAAPVGFSFSSAISAGAGTGGSFGFGSPAPNAGSAPPAAGLFSFATPAASAQASAFSFGMPPASSAAAAAAAAAATPAGGVFTLGGNAPKLSLGGSATTTATTATGGFGLGSSGGLAGSGASSSVPGTQVAAPAATPAGFVFGSAATTPPQPAPAAPAASGGFSFGGVAQTGAPNFSLGSLGSAPPQTASTGPTFGIVPASTNAAVSTAAGSQAAPAFSLGTASTGSGFGALAPASVTSTATALSFGAKPGGTTVTSVAPAITSSSSLLSLSGPTLFASVPGSSAPAACTATSLSGAASIPAAGFLLNLKPLATTSVAASTSTATTTTGMTPPVMTYAQLESLINKWSLELEDQEKHFLQQATQVNAWDRTLIENGEKITTLHREVEKVKLDQKRLDQELDFILSQQKELEDLLIPLEESVKEQSGTIYLQHADEEREKTYKLAENIDAQLKRMAQDLKDIIEHLNTSGGPADNSDPLQQICKILNAHMDSLQWIDQNSALLQRKVEEMTKVCESRRKEQERSFRITFD
ncbi:nucleoporin-62 C-terminal-like protein isoform X2 [Ahaetulla prasina]|uniref:nucleoporin-62 C-terminal-like protein isoform X2 n=1 Tax=Ahaetulla prasina TaxID=499056 RepID=UPI002648803D|nr:nucleoporin-62 C-terminal-like protein isoform X2 [Ahaetulla prasina]